MKVVIVGGGVAAVSTAKALVETAGSLGLPVPSVDVHCDETIHYYYRPKLPDYLAGRVGAEGMIAHDPAWYSERGILYHPGSRVDSIDAMERRITLGDGTRVGFDRLVLATGAEGFIPDIPGIRGRGVFTLRGIGDADAIREYVRTGVRDCAIIGGGLLGLETAAALLHLGVGPTVMEVADRLLPRQLDGQSSGILRGMIEGMGIRVLTDVRVKELMPIQQRPGSIVFTDGHGNTESMPTGMVLVNAGIAPRVGLGAAIGIGIGRGYLVDDHMRTSVPGIYAVGDCAEHRGKIPGMVGTALAQAKAAASHILDPGNAKPHAGTVPQTTLKVVGCDVTSMGTVVEGPGIDTVWGGDGVVFRKLFLRGATVVGAVLLGTKKGLGLITKAIESGEVQPPERLAEMLGT